MSRSRKRSSQRPAQRSRPSGQARKPARQPARQPARKNAQAPGPRPFLTPDATPFRRAVERRSALVVVFLRRLPRPVPGLVVLGLVAAGLIAPPVAGGIALLFVAALLAWLVFLSWPSMPMPGRLLRLVVVAMVIAYAFVRFAGT